MCHRPRKGRSRGVQAHLSHILLPPSWRCIYCSIVLKGSLALTQTIPTTDCVEEIHHWIEAIHQARMASNNLARASIAARRVYITKSSLRKLKKKLLLEGIKWTPTKDPSEITYFLGTWNTSLEDGSVSITQFFCLTYCRTIRNVIFQICVHLNGKQDCQTGGLWRRWRCQICRRRVPPRNHWLGAISHSWYTSRLRISYSTAVPGHLQTNRTTPPRSKASIIVKRCRDCALFSNQRLYQRIGAKADVHYVADCGSKIGFWMHVFRILAELAK